MADAAAVEVVAMTLVATRNVPAVIADGGEVIPLDLTVALSAEAAGVRLFTVQRVLRELRRYEGWLTQIVTDHIAAVPGRTEVRVGETVFELKPDSAWEITDAAALYGRLSAALERGEITDEEFNEAAQTKQTFSFHNGRLNALAKRIPEISEYRTKVETPAKLRVRDK